MSTSTQGIIKSFENNLLNNKLFYNNPKFLEFLNDYVGVVDAGYEPLSVVLDVLAAFDTSTLDAAELASFEQLQGKLSLNIYETEPFTVPGTLQGTSFADSIVVDTTFDIGIYVLSSGTIMTGAGNDKIIGISTAANNPDGIVNSGTIMTEAGNDILRGEARGGGLPDGIDNRNIIDTGDGNDVITGVSTNVLNEGSGSGLVNRKEITTGNGDDTITGIGNTNFGIYNEAGTIMTGAGNDKIIGSGAIGIFTLNIGSRVGLIDTGTGDDIVDALTGGFEGDGTIALGADNDTLKGFGRGNFDGGTGTDTIILGTGTYTIAAVDDGFRINRGGLSGTYSNFEQIGGTSGSTLALTTGFLSINTNGVASYVTPA